MCADPNCTIRNAQQVDMVDMHMANGIEAIGALLSACLEGIKRIEARLAAIDAGGAGGLYEVAELDEGKIYLECIACKGRPGVLVDKVSDCGDIARFIEHHHGKHKE